MVPFQLRQRSSMRMREQVLYDGQCPFCIRSMNLLQRLDWRHRLEFINARDLEHLPPEAHRLSPDRLMEEMHVITPQGGLLHGFKAARWLAWKIPLAWPVLPLVYLPGAAWLGQRIYLWIARHRFQLIPCHGGVCSIQPPRGSTGERPSLPKPSS